VSLIGFLSNEIWSYKTEDKCLKMRRASEELILCKINEAIRPFFIQLERDLNRLFALMAAPQSEGVSSYELHSRSVEMESAEMQLILKAGSRIHRLNSVIRRSTVYRIAFAICLGFVVISFLLARFGVSIDPYVWNTLLSISVVVVIIWLVDAVRTRHLIAQIQVEYGTLS
jgi:hypothetical protein